MRAHLIQKMAVVADDDHGGIVIVERTLEPADRMNVEIVGRLIEQEHIRLREQRLREQHAQFQAGRHFAHRCVVARLGNARIGQDAAGARLGIVAAVLGEHALELGRLHVVRIGGIRVGVNEVALPHRLPQLRVAAHHHIEHPLILVGELVLIQSAEAHARLQHDIAGARLQLAAEHLHESGLAGAVGADESIAVTVGELDRDLFEQRFRAKLNGDIRGSKHLHPMITRNAAVAAPTLSRSSPLGVNGADSSGRPFRPRILAEPRPGRWDFLRGRGPRACAARQFASKKAKLQ